MSRQLVPLKMVAANAVDSSKIVDGSIVTADLASSVLSPYVKSDGTPTFSFGPQTTDWFRVATGDGGLYNITRNKGITFGGGVLSEYPSGFPLSKAQLRFQVMSAPAGNTTSGSFVALPSPLGTHTFTAAGGILVVWVDVNFSNNTAGAGNFLGIQFDAAGYLNVHSMAFPTANSAWNTGFIWAQGVAAGARTVNIGWRVGGGTAAMNTGVYSKVIGVEFL